ncbi:MAG TPA: hypothetical protein DD405_03770 [Desulfobacteraceae bacterium]|nr:hypothetical protein [Desulfobacteraceae bacterium]
MENIEKIMEQLSKEILSNLGEMSKIKDTAERKSQAEIVNLLCQSMTSVMDSIMSEMSPFPFIDDDYDDEEC